MSNANDNTQDSIQLNNGRDISKQPKSIQTAQNGIFNTMATSTLYGQLFRQEALPWFKSVGSFKDAYNICENTDYMLQFLNWIRYTDHLTMCRVAHGWLTHIYMTKPINMVSVYLDMLSPKAKESVDMLLTYADNPKRNEISISLIEAVMHSSFHETESGSIGRELSYNLMALIKSVSAIEESLYSKHLNDGNSYINRYDTLNHEMWSVAHVSKLALWHRLISDLGYGENGDSLDTVNEKYKSFNPIMDHNLEFNQAIGQTQCNIIRQHITWETIEELVNIALWSADMDDYLTLHMSADGKVIR
jgi:hypothetical protein